MPSRSSARAVLGPIALLLSLAPASAQDATLAAAERELATMFDRPAGTPISAEAKAKLGAFLERHAGRDLAHLGYARALHSYLTGRHDAAVTELDEFFERHARIANDEHRLMAGRIYYAAVWRDSRAGAGDVAGLTRHAERMAALYTDSAMLERVVPSMLERVDEPTARALRLAIARGTLAAEVPAEVQERVLAMLFAGRANGSEDRIPAAALRPQPAAATAAGAGAEAIRNALTGQPAPALELEHVVQGAADFSLESLRGKVVVLDFTATWCGPCRGIVADLIALQKRHAGTVQVVAATRLYGRGLDFSPAGSAPPHDGKSVTNLDRAAEIAVNEAFVRAFGIDYPLVIANGDVASKLYGVTGIPTVFVIGRDGKVVGHVVGAGDRSHEQLEQLVTKALE